MLTEFEAVQDGSDTVFVKTCRLSQTSGQIVIRVFIRRLQDGLREADGLVEHSRVPGDEDIAAVGERQPEVIVGTASPHASARWRMPPMLNISFRELTGRAQEQVLAHEAAARRGRAPSRPATDRGSRRRRPTDSIRFAPKGGTPESDTAASRSPAC